MNFAGLGEARPKSMNRMLIARNVLRTFKAQEKYDEGADILPTWCIQCEVWPSLGAFVWGWSWKDCVGKHLEA